MRRVLKWIIRLVIALAVVGVVIGIWKRAEIQRLMAVNSLFSEEKIVHNFSNMNAAFLTRPVPVSGVPAPLASGPAIELPAATAGWITARNVTGLVVLKDGAIVHEDYFLGTKPTDRRISWSVAKSFVSALMGIALRDGAIASIDDPVTRYAPSLANGAYARASIRNVLQMSSGVTFDEDYLDFNSDINKMGRTLALGQSMDAFTEGLRDTFSDPGDAFQYVSIDTHVLGMVLRGAMGHDLPTLVSERLAIPMGLESDIYYVTDGYGAAFALGGLNMTTRDYARFGQMFLQDGAFNGQQILPADWVRASTTPSANTAPGKRSYGYQWWMASDPRDGEFFGHGIYGQYVYVNRPLGVVIAVNGADRGFRDDGVGDMNVTMLRAIAEAAQ